MRSELRPKPGSLSGSPSCWGFSRPNELAEPRVSLAFSAPRIRIEATATRYRLQIPASLVDWALPDIAESLEVKDNLVGGLSR